MIAYLEGIIHTVNDDSLILLVAGVGYEVYLGGKSLLSFRKGDPAAFYTHQHVREDQLTLYGFQNEQELLLFKKLISVSGIGPKSGLGVLDGASVGDVVLAVQAEDHALLTTVPGIGPKTAKRVILELKNKLDMFGGATTEGSSPSNLSVKSDILAALEVLGYSASEVHLAIQEVELDDLSVDQAVNVVLQALSRS